MEGMTRSELVNPCCGAVVSDTMIVHRDDHLCYAVDDDGEPL